MTGWANGFMCNIWATATSSKSRNQPLKPLVRALHKGKQRTWAGLNFQVMFNLLNVISYWKKREHSSALLGIVTELFVPLKQGSLSHPSPNHKTGIILGNWGTVEQENDERQNCRQPPKKKAKRNLSALFLTLVQQCWRWARCPELPGMDATRNHT